MAKEIRYWLMKSEPVTYGIDHLEHDGATPWEGVRNYQARNFMMEMKKGDKVLFYHSVTAPVGVAGIAKVVREHYPDRTQFDRKSKYFEPRATDEKPVWELVDVKFVKKFKKVVPLATLRETKGLERMEILKRGSRLSVTPVTKKEFEIIVRLPERVPTDVGRQPR